MMEETNPTGERCLTPEERREIYAEWNELRGALEPIGMLVEKVDDVDCDELYAAFLRFSGVFDGFEHSIMRAKQIRLLHAGHAGDPSSSR